MTIQQVADKLGVSTKTLRRWEEIGCLMPAMRQERTDVRLYDPNRIDYWEKLFDLRRIIKKHLKALDGIKKALDEHTAEQDFVPGKPLKLLTEEDLDKFTKARDEEDKWNKEFDRLLSELRKYPLAMRRFTSEVEGEQK